MSLLLGQIFPTKITCPNFLRNDILPIDIPFVHTYNSLDFKLNVQFLSRQNLVVDVIRCYCSRTLRHAPMYVLYLCNPCFGLQGTYILFPGRHDYDEMVYGYSYIQTIGSFLHSRLFAERASLSSRNSLELGPNTLQ